MSIDDSIVGFWDYGPDGHVVEVDEAGAGRVECAWPPGDQLKHLQCPPTGCLYAQADD